MKAVSSSQINLQWKDKSSNESAFLIECSLDKTNFAQIASVPANTQNYSASGLQAHTRYFLRVRATNLGGNSAYSNTADAPTLH